MVLQLARSTFNRHKDAIEDIFGIYIECDHCDKYKYYIGNAEVLENDTIQNWMLSTMTVNNLLSNNLNIHNRILVEVIPSSEEHLSSILEAMQQIHIIVKLRRNPFKNLAKNLQRLS